MMTEVELDMFIIKGPWIMFMSQRHILSARAG